MSGNAFPFAAVEGEEEAKRAFLFALVNPRCGGLLLSGGKGTGKSTLARGAAELTDGPWAEAPLSITEDRLFGALDVEAALRTGERMWQAGLLREADGGVLYIDDVNLLRGDLLRPILTAEEDGGFQLERDGFSRWETSRFTLLAVMNPEEGTLPLAVLDHFGLFAEVRAAEKAEERYAILKKVLDFERDGIVFREEWREETGRLRESVAAAKRLLPEVSASEAMLQLAAVYTLKAHCAGHRADIFLLETARAVAALAGRRYVLPHDLEEAALYVLPHRMRQPPQNAQEEKPEENPKADPNEIKQPQDGESPSEDSRSPEENRGEESAEPLEEREESSRENYDGTDGDKAEGAWRDERVQPQEDRTDSADFRVTLPPIWVEWEKDKKTRKGSGKRNLTCTDAKQGRAVRSKIPKGKAADIAFDATFRAAAPFQKARRGARDGKAILLRREDLRVKVRERRVGQVFLFCVDASGSMGAMERMKLVKGVIFKMLLDAYQKRDRVGLISFRRKKAELLLPVTRSIDLAEKCLAALPTGGKTPLAAGLELAEREIIRLSRQDPSLEPALILVTDGRATSPLAEGGDAVKDAVAVAGRIGKRGFPVAVIDTEHGFLHMGISSAIAKEMGAAYYAIDRLTEESLLRITKNVGQK